MSVSDAFARARASRSSRWPSSAKSTGGGALRWPHGRSRRCSTPPPDRRADVRPRLAVRRHPARRLADQAVARRVRPQRWRAPNPRAPGSRGDRVVLVHSRRDPRAVSRRHRGDPRRWPRGRLPRLVSTRTIRSSPRTTSGRSRTARSRRSVRFTGERPRGHRAPYWAFSDDTIGVLEDAGFVYDSSLMADDYRPYRVRRGRPPLGRRRGRRSGPRAASSRSPSTGPSTTGRSSSRGSTTVATGCDRHRRSSRSGSPSCATRTQHAPGGLLTVTMHPECIGRGHRMAMVEQFIAEAKALDGVVFDRVDRYLDRWQRATTSTTS